MFTIIGLDKKSCKDMKESEVGSQLFNPGETNHTTLVSIVGLEERTECLHPQPIQSRSFFLYLSRGLGRKGY